jgi:hypothetical protein
VKTRGHGRDVARLAVEESIFPPVGITSMPMQPD